MMRFFIFLDILFFSITLGAQTIEEYNNLINVYPDNPLLYDSLGVLFVKNGDITNAEKFFRKAVKLDRFYSNGWYHLGLIKLNQKEYDAASGLFMLAVTIDTNNLSALNNLGSLYTLKNELSMAENYYKQALSIKSDDPLLLNNMGVLAIKEKDFTSAVNYLEKALQLKEDEEIRFNLAVAYYYKKDLEKIKSLYPVISSDMKLYKQILKLLQD